MKWIITPTICFISEIKEFKLNLKEIKEIRKALALATQNIDCIEEEERYEEISKLYDLFEQAEEELEEEE